MRVVDAVAYHGHCLALGLQLLHEVFLVLWLHLRAIVLDAGFCGNSLGTLVFVARTHIDLYALVLKCLHGLAGMGLEDLGGGGGCCGLGGCCGGSRDCGLSKGTSLVYYQGVDAAQLLKGCSVLDEYVFLRSLAYAHHEGGGGGQSHGTGTGNDQHADSR